MFIRHCFDCEFIFDEAARVLTQTLEVGERCIFLLNETTCNKHNFSPVRWRGARGLSYESNLGYALHRFVMAPPFHNDV